MSQTQMMVYIPLTFERGAGGVSSLSLGCTRKSEFSVSIEDGEFVVTVFCIVGSGVGARFWMDLWPSGSST
jgi:hypothetical protein